MSSSRKQLEWWKLGEFALVFFVLPVLLFWAIGREWAAVLKVSYYVLIALFVLQAAMSYVQSCSAITEAAWEKAAPHTATPVPRTTFIVSAYLPNEVGVIEETLLHILRTVERPAAGIEIILAYNTPQFLDMETRLRDLAYRHPELILANAYGSRSKSQNQNYALDLASGGMIVLLDADHRVAPDCLTRAWAWIENGYDVVQGRCSVRNGADGIVPALVSVEFQAIYGVSHFAKFRLFNTALFGGSNGYWHAEVLKRVRFRNDRLTEDIDATLRATLEGYRFVHDRRILCTEEAPTALAALWFQRKRWAQGWYQCSVAYQGAVLRCPHLRWREKFIWSTLLLWRVVYDLLSHLLFPILVAYWLYRGRIEFPITPYIVFALVFTLLSGPFETLVALVCAAPRLPLRRYLGYAAVSFLYTTFKNIVQVVAIRDELMGQKEWIRTERVKA